MRRRWGDIRNRGRWDTPGVIDRLGVVSDGVIAEEIGVSRQAVSQMRIRLGIQSTEDRREQLMISPELIAKLGSASDIAIAKEFGLCVNRVRRARMERGIQKWRPPYKHGTRAGYNQGCKCDACRGAHAAHISAFRAKNPDRWEAIRQRRRAKVLASAPHEVGHVSWYAFGCRCDGCHKAHREYVPGILRRRYPRGGDSI